eukprot:scaffold48717_cov53-Phaeocystis_antarctica.AAC.1
MGRAWHVRKKTACSEKTPPLTRSATGDGRTGVGRVQPLTRGPEASDTAASAVAPTVHPAVHSLRW